MPKRKRTQQEVEMAHAPVPIPVPISGSTPTRPKRTRSPKKKVAEESWDAYGDPQEAEGSPLTDLDVESSPKKAKKGGGKRKAKEPVVYTEKEIPPVERKFIDFKGRLGYACLNTILRETKPEPIFCSRTCRKDTIHKNGLDFAKDLGLKNTRDLIKLIEWNEAHHIRFMRISSEMFPFASHAELGYDLSYAKDELKAVGDLAKKLGHRLTTHPGQFTQLASPKEAVVDASVRELDYHCQMMRYMGLGKDSVIILHMGGVYNDKPTTIARFRENYLNKLTQEMKDRLVLENDEMCYSVDDLLPICEELSVPIVLDYHHNWINPSVIPLPTLIPRLNKTWFSKSIRPKQHLSSPRPAFADGSGTIMDRRAHADRCYTLPEELGMEGVARDVDLMVEAKGKEQAVLMLYRIYGLESVEWGSLRPEKEVVAVVGKGKEEDGEEGVGESPGKKRKTRGFKAKDKTVVDEDEDAEYDGALDSPKTKKRGAKAKAKAVKDEDDEYTGDLVSPKRKTRSTRAKKDETAISPSTPKSPSKRTSKRKPKLTTTEAMSLINQEDAPVPVDGADVKDVEMEEHPEAVGAAVCDGDGCGVSGGAC